jgi:hypothetical protein
MRPAALSFSFVFVVLFSATSPSRRLHSIPTRFAVVEAYCPKCTVVYEALQSGSVPRSTTMLSCRSRRRPTRPTYWEATLLHQQNLPFLGGSTCRRCSPSGSTSGRGARAGVDLPPSAPGRWGAEPLHLQAQGSSFYTRHDVRGGSQDSRLDDEGTCCRDAMRAAAHTLYEQADTYELGLDRHLTHKQCDAIFPGLYL